MSPSPSLRRFCLFLLIFGVFAPRALSASFGVCMPGWEWVSGPLGFSMIMWFELPEGDDLCTFLPQANNSMNQNPCEIAGVLDVQCGPVGE